MPTTDAHVFSSHLDAWTSYQSSPWGRVRYRVARETLARTCAALGGGRLRVLDVGGGDGGDALAVAAAGHDVTVVDVAEALLARSAEAGLATVTGSVTELADLGLGTFDLVLCHNVVHYLDETGPAVAQLAGAVAPGGALSLMAPNPDAEVLAAVSRRHDVVEAFGLLDAPTARTVTFDHDVRRVSREEALAALAAQGFSEVTSYGLRSVCDFIADDERKHDPAYYADLERLELALCDREPFVRTARLWQLVGRRAA